MASTRRSIGAGVALALVTVLSLGCPRSHSSEKSAARVSSASAVGAVASEKAPPPAPTSPPPPDDKFPLDDAAIDAIVAIFERHGAVAKVSSIHVNGYFGTHDKLTMCKRCLPELLGEELDPERAVFLGDSPNDEPMFRFFPHAVGVANLRSFAHRMSALPRYLTRSEGGEGFAEFLQILLARRSA